MSPEIKLIIGDDGELLEADTQANLEMYEDQIWEDASPNSPRENPQDFINNHIPIIIVGLLIVGVFVIALINMNTHPDVFNYRSDITAVPTRPAPTALLRRHLPAYGRFVTLPLNASVTQLHWSPDQSLIAYEDSVNGLSIWNTVDNKPDLSNLLNYDQFGWSPSSCLLYLNRNIASPLPQNPLLTAVQTCGKSFNYEPIIPQPDLLTSGTAQQLVVSKGNKIALLLANGFALSVVDPEPPHTVYTHTLNLPAHDLDWIGKSSDFTTVDLSGVWKWSENIEAASQILNGQYQQVSWASDAYAFAVTQDSFRAGSHHPSVSVFTAAGSPRWSHHMGSRDLSMSNPADFNVQVLWSPDGNQIATFLRGDTIVSLWNAATGQYATDLDTLSPITSIDWSPGGNYLAVGSTSGIVIWSPD